MFRKQLRQQRNLRRIFSETSGYGGHAGLLQVHLKKFFVIFAVLYTAVGVNVFLANPWEPSIVGLFVGIETTLFISNAPWSEVVSAIIVLGAFFSILFPSPITVFSIVSGLFGCFLLGFYILNLKQS